MALPALAGSYFNWEAAQARGVPANIGGILAVAGTHDSGPDNSAVLCRSWQEFVSGPGGDKTLAFGASETALSRAVFLGFKGQGFGGRGGAGSILVIRQAGSAAARASKALLNTTPATALTLTAKHKGTRANTLRITVQAGVVVGTKDLIVLDGALVKETYNFADSGAGALAALAAEINLLSDLITAAVNLDAGVTLANIASTAMTGGNDGATLVGGDWTATEAILDINRWSVFAPANLTDSTILTALRAWHKARNTNGDRCLLVTGGAEDGSGVSTAVTRAQGTNGYDEVVLGAFTVHDTTFNRDQTSAEFASRFAGATIARGYKNDSIFVRFSDCTLVSGPSLAGQEACVDGGVTTLSRDTFADAPVFVREGVTSYSSDALSTVDASGAKTHPVALYKRIKNVRIQHAIENDAQEWATSGAVLGELVVNDRSRALVTGHFKEIYQGYQDAEIVQPGWTVGIDVAATAENGGDDSDGIFVLHGFHPTRSARIILHTARIG